MIMMMMMIMMMTMMANLSLIKYLNEFLNFVLQRNSSYLTFYFCNVDGDNSVY